jgi:hypothetical protein
LHLDQMEEPTGGVLPFDCFSAVDVRDFAWWVEGLFAAGEWGD